MLGVDDSPQNLGVIPCAIAWLYRLIDDRKQSTATTRFSVRVSAVEVTGRQETLTDLLAGLAVTTSGTGMCYNYQRYYSLPALVELFDNRPYINILTCCIYGTGRTQRLVVLPADFQSLQMFRPTKFQRIPAFSSVQFWHYYLRSEILSLNAFRKLFRKGTCFRTPGRGTINQRCSVL